MKKVLYCWVRIMQEKHHFFSKILVLNNAMERENDRNLIAKSPVKENNSYNTAKYGIEIIIENTIYSRKRNDIIEFE